MYQRSDSGGAEGRVEEETMGSHRGCDGLAPFALCPFPLLSRAPSALRRRRALPPPPFAAAATQYG